MIPSGEGEAGRLRHQLGGGPLAAGAKPCHGTRADNTRALLLAEIGQNRPRKSKEGLSIDRGSVSVLASLKKQAARGGGFRKLNKRSGRVLGEGYSQVTQL
jgi:hypothetical protein